MKHLKKYNEIIKVPIEVGDTILGGKFKNKKTIIKKIGKNKKGDITVNDKPLLRWRIPKSNEGLFNIFKKKEKEKVGFDDIMDCLYDLTDEFRIQNELNGLTLPGIFASEDVVFKKFEIGDLFFYGLDDDHDALINDELYSDRNFKIRKNCLSFNFTYNPNEISDEEVSELLLDCKSKLEMYNCEISFFIGWGRDEGSTSDEKWNNFMDMIRKTILKSSYPERNRNITVVIKSPGGFK